MATWGIGLRYKSSSTELAEQVAQRIEGTAVGAANELKEASRPFVGQKKWQDEIQVLTAAIDYLSSAVAIVRRERIVLTLAALYVERAQSHLMSGDSVSAIRTAVVDFDAALRLNPNDEAVKRSTANAYNSLGCKDKGPSAIKDFDRAIEVSPRSALFIRNRGIEYLNQHDYDHAIEDLSRACEISDDPEYRKSLAAAYNGKGCKIHNLNRFSLSWSDKNTATEAFSMAMKLDPSNKTYSDNFFAAVRTTPRY
jgi:tetratricopeptide (TPR) repeat protein